MVRRIAEKACLAGIHTEIVVPEESDIPLRERVRRVNALCAKYGTQNCALISVHINAAGNEGKWLNARGWTGWVAPKFQLNTLSLQYGAPYHAPTRIQVFSCRGCIFRACSFRVRCQVLTLSSLTVLLGSTSSKARSMSCRPGTSFQKFNFFWLLPNHRRSRRLLHDCYTLKQAEPDCRAIDCPHHRAIG